MAKLMFNGMEIADVTYTGGGGLPTFTETTIATGTSGGTVTFTGDYHDYPLLIIRCTNSSTGAVTDLLSSPDMLDAIFDVTSNEIVFNEAGNNQYGSYIKNDATTWNRVGARNLYVSEVIGLTCDNYTITETEIYNKGSYSAAWQEITGTGFLSYDMLLIALSIDGVQPNVAIVSNNFLGSVVGSYGSIITPYNSSYPLTVTDTKLSSAPYHYVGGLKFT